MSRLFTSFFRRNLAAAKVGILSQLEYRINFAIDAVVQPLLSSGIEAMVWMGILAGMGQDSLGGFGREYYLAYALWATFVGRVTINWMYEFTMLDDIDTGKINSILTRPISFYEFYLSQFVGYKLCVSVASFVMPIAICKLLNVPMDLSRLPGMLALVVYYLIFSHTLSFCVACLAFFLNKAQSFTVMKNLMIWTLSGELIPLDLYPEPLRTWLINSPLACGAYIPVGYITGRIGPEVFWPSFINLTIGIAVVGVLAQFLWRRGVRAYTGTGA